MKLSKSKTLAIMIAMLLVISMGTTMVFLPTASAHTPPQNLPTNAYLAPSALAKHP
jgi:hypothetical protein